MSGQLIQTLSLLCIPNEQLSWITSVCCRSQFRPIWTPNDTRDQTEMSYQAPGWGLSRSLPYIYCAIVSAACQIQSIRTPRHVRQSGWKLTVYDILGLACYCPYQDVEAIGSAGKSMSVWTPGHIVEIITAVIGILE